VVEELASIRKLLILLLLKTGASSGEVDMATGMGAGNIRKLFPGVEKGLQVKQTKKDE